LTHFLFSAHVNSHFHSVSNWDCHLKLKYLCFPLSLIDRDICSTCWLSIIDLKTNVAPALLPICILTLPYMLVFLTAVNLKATKWFAKNSGLLFTPNFI
jgi:hypothetical protein